jgi:hypothetical protein
MVLKKRRLIFVSPMQTGVQNLAMTGKSSLDADMRRYDGQVRSF